MNWEYGKIMLDEGYIKSLNDWCDDKEYVYKTMDRKFDYLWWEDKEGIHFIDRLYHAFSDDEDGEEVMNGDEWIKERKENNELELLFKTLEEAKEWLNKKEKENK